MNKRKIAILLAVCAMGCMQAQVAFTGSSNAVIEETPAASTGLSKIYVLRAASGVNMTYTAESASAEVKWSAYGEGGGGYATELTGITRNGAVYTLTDLSQSRGYIIEEGTKRTYVWVVNYSDYMLDLQSIDFQSTDECGTTTLQVTGSGADMGYYTINGVYRTLDREIALSYNTLVFDEENLTWNQTLTTENESGFKSSIVVPAPLCNTTFTISGDKYLEQWGEKLSVESDIYTTSSVDVYTTAVQESRENDNEVSNDGSSGSLGGSAPVNLTLTAYCTDAVNHKQWQLSSDSEFSTILQSFLDDKVETSMTEAGTFYWRFVGQSDNGTCEAISDTYTVNVGTSELKIPNVFTPNGDEVNDVWKVSYSSLVSFHCWIYNRWGVKVAELTDASQGWDGKYKGKYVDAGVYYYVIQAEGADGVKYKKSGDINIIGHHKNSSSTGTSTGD